MDFQKDTYNYLEKLNSQQREAVEYLSGPSLVIAGAGSGKTRVLTYKIVHLLNNGFEPYRILALTFTNKAAREMKERISSVVGEKTASRLWMGTFHSIFLRILRNHTGLIGFNKNFTIYDASDSKTLIKNIIKDQGLDDKVYKPATIASIISNAKNALVSADMYARDSGYTESDRIAKRPRTADIYRLYCERCRLADAMDFDDILFYMNVLLRDNPDVLRHYQEFFKYILVDEYQDTNFAQHLIITQLAGENQNICVVGDDAQSIYSFRGANIANILNLQRCFPKLETFKLERNYRSTQNIINAASSLIEKNTNQFHKNVYSENAVGTPVNVIQSYSDLEESFLVANSISKSKLSQHDSYDDYAILYRTNAQSRILEESLRKRNIPYRIYGGLSFYQRKEVKDAICYFRLAINSDDDEALRRVINYPARGIGETTVKKIQATAIENRVSMWQIICSPASFNLAINSGTAKKLGAFAQLISSFKEDIANGSNAYELGQLIINSAGLMAVFANDNTPESITKQENLSELLSGLKEFVVSKIEAGDDNLSMEAFLSEVSLATDQDSEDSDEPKVTLMTVHAAKGLEFSNVYIVGVEEDLFPSAMSMDSTSEIEEERRLMYVAITRAKNNCTITYAGSRYRNGETRMTRPSRFISEISTRFLKLQSSNGISTDHATPTFVNPLQRYHATTTYDNTPTTTYRKPQQPTFSGKSSGSWVQSKLRKISDVKESGAGGNSALGGASKDVAEGTRIRHARFGEGTITKVDKSSGDTVIEVNFDNVGNKKLLLKFAKFEII